MTLYNLPIHLHLCRQVINETQIARDNSDDGDTDSQLFCFGLGNYLVNLLPKQIFLLISLSYATVYPDNCTRYYGPHPVSCLITMWKNATCLALGYKYPEKLSTSRLTEIDTWNIRFEIYRWH